MGNFSFDIADEKDNKSICDILRNNILKGHISLSFRREPSYFQACKIQGLKYQVIKCIKNYDQSIIGIGARFIYSAYINEKKQTIGYLSDLRIDKKYRRGILLAKGYSFLKKLHKAEPVPFYLSMILEGNKEAINILTSQRAGLPIYRSLGKIYTPAIFLDKYKTFPQANINVEIRKASKQDMPRIFEFINKECKKKQFAPYYDISDFESHRLLGLKAEDFYIASANGILLGVIAAWDQTAFRQTYVEKYNRTLKFVKPFYNIFSKIFKYNPLIQEGNPIPFFYVSLIAIVDNDIEVFSSLLRYMYNDRSNSKWHYFICGLHEKDPLYKVLNDYKKIDVYGNLYCVYYPENEKDISQLDDNKIPYIEIATL